MLDNKSLLPGGVWRAWQVWVEGCHIGHLVGAGGEREGCVGFDSPLRRYYEMRDPGIHSASQFLVILDELEVDGDISIKEDTTKEDKGMRFGEAVERYYKDWSETAKGTLTLFRASYKDGWFIFADKDEGFFKFHDIDGDICDFKLNLEDLSADDWAVSRSDWEGQSDPAPEKGAPTLKSELTYAEGVTELFKQWWWSQENPGSCIKPILTCVKWQADWYVYVNSANGQLMIYTEAQGSEKFSPRVSDVLRGGSEDIDWAVRPFKEDDRVNADDPVPHPVSEKALPSTKSGLTLAEGLTELSKLSVDYSGLSCRPTLANRRWGSDRYLYVDPATDVIMYSSEVQGSEKFTERFTLHRSDDISSGRDWEVRFIEDKDKRDETNLAKLNRAKITSDLETLQANIDDVSRGLSEIIERVNSTRS